MSKDIDNFFSVITEKTGLKHSGNREYGEIRFSPNSAIIVHVKEKTVAVAFETQGKEKDLPAADLMNWANQSGLLSVEVLPSIYFELKQGVKNKDKVALIVELPYEEGDILLENLDKKVIEVIGLLKEKLAGVAEINSAGVSDKSVHEEKTTDLLDQEGIAQVEEASGGKVDFKISGGVVQEFNIGTISSAEKEEFIASVDGGLDNANPDDWRDYRFDSGKSWDEFSNLGSVLGLQASDDLDPIEINIQLVDNAGAIIGEKTITVDDMLNLSDMLEGESDVGAVLAEMPSIFNVNIRLSDHVKESESVVIGNEFSVVDEGGCHEPFFEVNLPTDVDVDGLLDDVKLLVGRVTVERLQNQGVPIVIDLLVGIKFNSEEIPMQINTDFKDWGSQFFYLCDEDSEYLCDLTD